MRLSELAPVAVVVAVAGADPLPCKFFIVFTLPRLGIRKIIHTHLILFLDDVHQIPPHSLCRSH